MTIILETFATDFRILIVRLLAVILALTIHELSHGLVSTMFGDPTPKEDGRLSLNPTRHIDPLGLVCLTVFGFGWAKPVRISPQYYKDPRQGMFYVSFAGPLSNFIFAFLSLFAVGVMHRCNIVDAGFAYWIYEFFYALTILNLGLCVFNLIPIPPLDGSKMIGAFMKEETYVKFLGFEQYGFIIIIFLFALGAITGPFTTMVEGIYEVMADIVIRIFGL